MSAPRFERRTLQGAVPLELIACETGALPGHAPLLFVHGAYVGAWCWAEHWLGWFAAQGHAAFALSLRGHGGSGGRESLDRYGLAEYAEDVAVAVAALSSPPVLVAHSMGALVVQKYLEDAACPAAVFLCPVPPTGVLAASLSLAFLRPALFAEIQAMAAGRRVSPRALHEVLLAGPAGEDFLARVCARMQPESKRAILDMSGWGLPQRWRMSRPEMLVVGAERDTLIPVAQAESAARLLGAEYREMPGLGHALMLEAAWRAPAQLVLDWLGARGLGRPPQHGAPATDAGRGARETR